MNEFTYDCRIMVCMDCMLARDCEAPEETDRTPWGLWAAEDHRYISSDRSPEGGGEGFSWSPCEGCGSMLGGERFAYAYLR